MVLTSAAYNIYFAANILTCIVVIATLNTAMQKKHYKAMGVIAFAFILSFFFASWIALAVSFGYLIGFWVMSKFNKNKIESKEITPTKEINKIEKEESSGEKKIKCRFCKKLYSPEYNGCPYCKKK